MSYANKGLDLDFSNFCVGCTWHRLHKIDLDSCFELGL